MTIKDYATSRAVSYEAVAKQVRQYKKKELKKHITYQGRTAELDDFAIEFLDKHRQPRSVVVKADSDTTQKELERLHEQVHQLQDELNKQKTITQAKSDKIQELLEEKNLLIEDKTKKEIYESELQEVKQELSRYQRTIFGLYRKV